MKRYILLLLLVSITSYSQQGYNEYATITLKVSQDPMMIFKEHSLDLRVEISFTEDNNVQFGGIFETFPKRKFFSAAAFTGYEFQFEVLGINVSATPYIEAGVIFRENPDTHLSTCKHYYTGIGTKFKVFITERFGLFINNAFITRGDLPHHYPKADNDKARYSNYGGAFIILN